MVVRGFDQYQVDATCDKPLGRLPQAVHGTPPIWRRPRADEANFVLLDAKVVFSACQDPSDKVNGSEKEDSDHSETKGPYVYCL